MLEDQAARIGTMIKPRTEVLVETPLLKELINRGAEDNTTAAGLLDIHDIHNVCSLGKVDLNSGGASGQVEQALEDQAAAETSPQRDLIEHGASESTPSIRRPVAEPPRSPPPP